MTGAVVVFARAPEAGKVKTRLAATLGEEFVLRLSDAVLADSLAAARGSGATVLLAHTPSAPFPAERLADATYAQRGASFGARFDAALSDARRIVGDEVPLVLIGADTPHLPPEQIRRALEALATSRAVLGPSPEGGFHLLGFAAAPVPVANAFESGNEAAGVVRVLAGSGIRTRLMPSCFDIDLPRDVAELAFHLQLVRAVGEGWVPPRTERVIAEAEFEIARSDGTRGLRIEPRPPRWARGASSPKRRGDERAGGRKL
jgi:glycosyltransferase A (GT-A) superfamily protein (DUF2064 family)